MCLSVKELLVIVSPPAYSPGAVLSHASLNLSHYYFSLCLCAPLHLSPLVFISLILSLPLSHPLYILPH